MENNHEAIIDPQTFDMVQAEFARRTAKNNRHSGIHILSHKIQCGDCGGWYGNKLWHSNDKYRREVWRCNQKYRNKDKRCATPVLDENDVRGRFTRALNKLPDGSDSAIRACEEALTKTLDVSELERKRNDLVSEMESLNGMLQQMAHLNATVPQDQTLYKSRFKELSQRFSEIEAKNDTEKKIRSMRDRRGAMEMFIKNLREQNTPVTEFREHLCCALLDYAISYADGRLVFRFKHFRVCGVKKEILLEDKPADQ